MPEKPHRKRLVLDMPSELQEAFSRYAADHYLSERAAGRHIIVDFLYRARYLRIAAPTYEE